MNTSIFMGRSLIMVGRPFFNWTLRCYRYPNDTRPRRFRNSQTRRDSTSEPNIALINNFSTIDPNIGPVINQTHENLDSDCGSLSLDNLRLPDASIHAIETIARAASNHGSKAYLVGGMVRDIVAQLPKISTSPDVAVIGDALKFAGALTEENSNCSLISASQLHTIKVKIGSVAIDIASARTDLYEPWGSLPQITLVNDIESDLQRRDFSVNAMAIQLSSNGLGVVIDPFNGRRDVAIKILRVIRENSFAEDPLRMLRGVRIAARYGYIFDAETAKEIQRSLRHLAKMCDVSPQRVFNEFRLWFQPHENLDALTAMAVKHGILKVFVPSADFRDGAFRQISQDVTESERFAAFAYLAPMDAMNNLAERLRMSSDWRAIVSETDIVRSVAKGCRTEHLSDVELWRSLIDVRDEVVRAAICVETDSDVSRRLIDFRDRLRPMRTAINGDDLISLGVERGPMIGQILDELLAARVEGSISNADEERAYVMRRLADG